MEVGPLKFVRFLAIVFVIDLLLYWYSSGPLVGSVVNDGKQGLLPFCTTRTGVRRYFSDPTVAVLFLAGIIVLLLLHRKSRWMLTWTRNPAVATAISMTRNVCLEMSLCQWTSLFLPMVTYYDVVKALIGTANCLSGTAILFAMRAPSFLPTSQRLGMKHGPTVLVRCTFLLLVITAGVQLINKPKPAIEAKTSDDCGLFWLSIATSVAVELQAVILSVCALGFEEAANIRNENVLAEWLTTHTR